MGTDLVISGLGREFDQGIDFKMKMLQVDLHAKIDANFQYAREEAERWRLWRELGICMWNYPPPFLKEKSDYRVFELGNSKEVEVFEGFVDGKPTFRKVPQRQPITIKINPLPKDAVG